MAFEYTTGQNLMVLFFLCGKTELCQQTNDTFGPTSMKTLGKGGECHYIGDSNNDCELKYINDTIIYELPPNPKGIEDSRKGILNIHCDPQLEGKVASCQEYNSGDRELTIECTILSKYGCVEKEKKKSENVGDIIIEVINFSVFAAVLAAFCFGVCGVGFNCIYCFMASKDDDDDDDDDEVEYDVSKSIFLKNDTSSLKKNDYQQLGDEDDEEINIPIPIHEDDHNNDDDDDDDEENLEVFEDEESDEEDQRGKSIERIALITEVPGPLRASIQNDERIEN